MRPLELRLKDFRSYRGDGTVFDFRDRTLVGIVGPIGSGKSSILDAVSFALYGKTPSIGSATKSLIHQRSAGGTVLLRFEVDGAVWEVVRALRRKGQSQHQLTRYDDDAPDAEVLERYTQEREVNDRIVDLLGLEFDAFGRSVLLAQGRFAEFLSARPAERDKVLKGVFGHDRVDAMREAAKNRAVRYEAELDKVGVRIEQLDRVVARLAENRVTLDSGEARLELLQKAEPVVDELDERESTTASRIAEVEARLAELAEAATRLPGASDTDRLLEEAVGAASRRHELALRLEKAERLAADAERQIATAVESGEVSVIERASSLLAANAPLASAAADARARQDAAGKREAAALQASATARRTLAEKELLAEAGARAAEAAAEEAEAAERELHRLSHANMAATLRAGVGPGDDCPVCDRPIERIPVPLPGVDLGGAEKALAVARERREAGASRHRENVADHRAAAEAVAGCERAVAVAAEEHAAAGAAVEAADEAVGANLAALAELLGAGDPEALLSKRRAAHQALTDAVATARKDVERARRSHDEAIRSQQQAERGLSDLRMRLVELATRLRSSLTIPDADAEALGRSLAELRKDWAATSQSLEDQLRELRAGRAALAAERAALLAELGVEGTFVDAVASLVASVDLLRREVGRDEQEIAASATLIEQRDSLEAGIDVYRRLAGDLTDSKFIRYLLDEERSRLAALGSDHFQRLSAGRYRFSEDGAFDIVDLTAADTIRKSDSLSGGETFLASLALALALAEMVARTGGRLDSFFLDEGFGSLDPEHLDLAMEGIEALVADGEGRLVVVVSHVPELRARLEDLIQLDRDPMTGDTRIVRA